MPPVELMYKNDRSVKKAGKNKGGRTPGFGPNNPYSLFSRAFFFSSSVRRLAG